MRNLLKDCYNLIIRRKRKASGLLIINDGYDNLGPETKGDGAVNGVLGSGRRYDDLDIAMLCDESSHRLRIARDSGDMLAHMTAIDNQIELAGRLIESLKHQSSC